MTNSEPRARSYISAELVVGGAHMEGIEFPDGEGFEEWLSGVQRDAADDPSGELTEVYVTEHSHAPEYECECAQYLLDHKPYWKSR